MKDTQGWGCILNIIIILSMLLSSLIVVNNNQQFRFLARNESQGYAQSF